VPRPDDGGALTTSKDKDHYDDEPGLLDEVADRLGFRARLKRNPALALAWRISVGVLGTLIVLLGLVLVPFPGPGWLIVFLGLGILATEFRAWLRWVGRQHIVVRALISIAALAFVGGVVVLTLWLSGMGVPFL
jgi:uncharacterized protein (TIGR02611 family)